MKSGLNIAGRIFFIIVGIIIQLLWTYLFIKGLVNNSKLFALLLGLLSFVVTLKIINEYNNPNAKLSWVILIFLFPLFGTIVYIFTNNTLAVKYMRKKIEKQDNYSKKFLKKNLKVIDEIAYDNENIASELNYLNNMGFPTYNSSDSNYYAFGQDGYKELIKELGKAKKYIFMEYFILEEGKMWDGILNILKEKAKSGIDVRIIYDDVGSLFVLKNKYFQELNSLGIKTIPFNPILPIFSIIVNNRDHRKMTIIDGIVAFTGGINIADEYINAKEKHGIWKDAVVKIKGEAIWSFTLMFLNMWNVNSKQEKIVDYEQYKNLNVFNNLDSYVCPYAHDPYNQQLVAYNVYLNIINNSKKYCYIYTPYLIIDHVMQSALILASKRGVDVRIVTPGIPDKKIIYQMTRANYVPLMDAGVKIFEYSKGFMHAKCFIVDDEIATVGSVNMDYRSLYHHFENGCVFYKGKVIEDMIKDFNNTFSDSKEVKKVSKNIGIIKMIYYAILNLIAPLM